MKINFTLFGARLTGGTFNLIEPANRLAMRGHDVSVTTIGTPTDLAWFRNTQAIHFKEYYAPLTARFLYRAFRKMTHTTKLSPMPETEIRDLVSVMPRCDINIATAAPTAFAVHRSGQGKGFYYVQHYDSLFGKDRLTNLVHDESYFLPLQKITVSSWLRTTITKALDVPISGVITAGIDETLFFPRPATRGTKKRIVSLGRRVAWKGFEELREAMGILFSKRDDFEWIVYSAHDTPEPTAAAPFTLHRLPSSQQLAEIYASCDIAVNPSWHEGFAQPALEAMACGCAVVTTPIGAEDFIEPDKNCLIVQPKDPAGLAAAIERLLDDRQLRETLMAAAVETGKRFAWDCIIDKWEATLAGR